MIYSCYGLFVASNSYDFCNQYCSNLLKNPTVRGLRNYYLIFIFQLVSDNYGYWRASEASETPSIATYREKCLGRMYVKTTMHMLTIYVKRRSGRSCIYEKPACCSRVQLRKALFTYVKTTKRMHIYFRSPINGNHFPS